MNTEQNNRKFSTWVRTSITARMIAVGFLILILLIPLEYTKSLIRERNNRQSEVVNEINEQWGKEVLLYGPILKVPYKVYHKKRIISKQKKEIELEEDINYAYFFPDSLNITSNINPEEKKRSIYKTAVYKGKINISGTFGVPDFSESDIANEDINWKKAKILIQTSNVKGVSNLVEIKVQDSIYPFKSKYKNTSANGYDYYDKIELHTLESKHISLNDLPLKNKKSFSLQISINGSKQIRFIPIGKQTKVNIKSDWKKANFIGEYLPYNSDKITETGFDAKWKVLDINRAFPQQFFNNIPDLQKYAFGVNFMIPIDEYQKNERSAKYGFLVIGLTFLLFFLIQTLSKILIHPFQYLMIGIALVLFYTLLLSFSEYISFSLSYLISSIATVMLISLYSKSILKENKFPVFVGLSLSSLYLFIFVITQMENYSLLVGSIGLFIILSIVMFVSRKIDWQ